MPKNYDFDLDLVVRKIEIMDYSVSRPSDGGCTGSCGHKCTEYSICGPCTSKC